PRMVLPVIFPPGRARLGTSPARTGSPIEIMTIGIVIVACLAAKLAGRGVGRNNVHWATYERCRGLSQPLPPPVTIRIVEGDVGALEVAEIAQSVPEGVPHGRVVDDANARNFRRLLPARTPHRERKQQPDTTD